MIVGKNVGIIILRKCKMNWDEMREKIEKAKKEFCDAD